MFNKKIPTLSDSDSLLLAVGVCPVCKNVDTLKAYMALDPGVLADCSTCIPPIRSKSCTKCGKVFILKEKGD